LYYYPIVTVLCLAGVLGGAWRWWMKKQQSIAYQQKEQLRLNRIQKFPELNAVYIPDFEKTVDTEIKTLKKELEKKGQTEVLKILEAMEEMIEQKLIPRKASLEETLENYISTNHLVLEKEIETGREKLQDCDDESMKKILESSLRNLEEKQKILKESHNELLYFYSQLKNILQQVENMRLKSSRLRDSDQLLLELKHDINDAFEGFSDANSLLDDLSKL